MGGTLQHPLRVLKKQGDRCRQRLDPQQRLGALPSRLPFSQRAHAKTQAHAEKNTGPGPISQSGTRLTTATNNVLMGSKRRAVPRSQGTQPTAETRGRLERSRPERNAHAPTRKGPSACKGPTGERSAGARARARADEAVTEAVMAPSPQVRVLRCCCCRLFQTHQVGRAPAYPSSWLRDWASCP